MGKKQPEKIRASTGFEPTTSANTGAMLYQLSYEATHWLWFRVLGIFRHNLSTIVAFQS